jgi:beta-N-acetylhexosaminidase
MLNFHQIPKNEIVPQEVVIPFAEHQKIASEVAKQSITLIKEEKGIFPLNPSKTPKVLIVPQHDENPFEAMMPKRKTIYEYIQEKLIQEGFQVEIFESLMDKAKKLPPPEAFKLIGNVYNNKTPVKDLKEKYDIIIHVCDFDSHNTVSRISWKMSKGTPDIPWYVHEIPTIMISLRSPFHLFDAPMVKTYINAYDKNLVTIDALIEKMMGRDTFVGKSSVDAFCGHPEIKYE